MFTAQPGLGFGARVVLLIFNFWLVPCHILNLIVCYPFLTLPKAKLLGRAPKRQILTLWGLLMLNSWLRQLAKRPPSLLWVFHQPFQVKMPGQR